MQLDLDTEDGPDVAGGRSLCRVYLLEHLHAADAEPEVASQLALFGRLVGVWHVRNALYSESTALWSTNELRWEFGWIISGRAIRDVLLNQAGVALGTTVRTWDSRAGWRVVWFCPRAAEHVVLTAHGLGDQIRLDGAQADGRSVKWVFSEIEADKFTWNGWCSNDGGESWWHEQQMTAQRVHG